MNILKEIYNSLEPFYRQVAVTLFSDSGVCFEIYEVKIPIMVDKSSETFYIDTSMTEFNLDVKMMEELLKVMKIIDDNIDEIKSWVE